MSTSDSLPNFSEQRAICFEKLMDIQKRMLLTAGKISVINVPSGNDYQNLIHQHRFFQNEYKDTYKKCLTFIKP
jgi:hypothetical protein